uniref:Uncharacterized protein n=1 Tax=Cacopsylla melanoneura TaxID=428564 RepID=A0A8D8Y125_9HEMI
MYCCSKLPIVICRLSAGPFKGLNALDWFCPNILELVFILSCCSECISLPNLSSDGDGFDGEVFPKPKALLKSASMPLMVPGLVVDILFCWKPNSSISFSMKFPSINEFRAPKLLE